MENPFFDKPIINSPYEYPSRHWELDEEGQPTQRIIDTQDGEPNSFRRFQNPSREEGQGRGSSGWI